jgi:anti-anti-sigma regulatory factor
VLLKEPGILLDPNFLGALHRELRSELGAAEANHSLFQMGFLHGLQDGIRARDDVFGEQPEAPGCTVAPPLPIQMRTDAEAAELGGVALRGLWPECTEAAVLIDALGKPVEPACFVSAGYTSGWLSGTLDANILALETSCSACGADTCSFAAREASVWRALGDPDVMQLLDALPFESFRAFVCATRDAQIDSNSETDQIESDRSVVHIWGPVMVVPFSSGDEALQAIDLIGRDPAASDVSVVVVDLSGAIIDESFGAMALEQIVDTIEAWGAEAIFAAVSPLSEVAVADLERQPLVTHKDLSQAVAAAFQIAAAQRCPA